MKKSLIIKLIELTKLQTLALEKENVDEFLELIDKRQEVLNQIQQLQEENPQLKEQHEESLVRELMEIDHKNRVEFEKQFEAVKGKLREIRQMKKREEQYSNPYDISREEGVFFDKKERR